MLDAGLAAPSGHNERSCWFTVVRNADRIREISDGGKEAMRMIPLSWIAELGNNPNFHIFHTAPTVIIVSARKDAVSPLPDACAAIENMLIAAESLGLGACWIGFAKFYFSSPERDRKFGIPEGYEVHYGVALGNKPDGPIPDPPERKSGGRVNIIR